MGFSPFRATGVTHHDEAGAYPGVTLYALLGGREMLLVDMRGEVVHRWAAPDPKWHCYHGDLLDDGHLLALFTTSGEGKPGGCGAIAELDWDGNMLWKHRNPWIHHDFVRRRNGNTMLLVWDRMAPGRGAQVLAQREKTRLPGLDADKMLGDVVREITPAGEVVWEWRAEDHLDPEIDVVCPLHNFSEWTHANSLDELPNGDLLVSFRLTDTLAIVSRETGEIRWKWGRRTLGHQHDAGVLPDGNVLVFDNCWHQEGQLDASRIVEVDPRTSTIAWEFRASPMVSFFSAHLGGVQRLPNGNTLITEGTSGRIFEVRRDGTIVWEYVTPFSVAFRADANSPRMAKARRYGLDHPGLARLRSR